MRPWRALLLAFVVSAAPASLAGEKVSNDKSTKTSARAPVDLNTATEHELEQLPGIGQKKAQAIVELRRRKPLTRLTQLMQVRGIGKKTLERLKPYVKLDPPAATATGSSSAKPKTAPATVPAPAPARV